MTLQKPTKNHFAPVFYLKAWAGDGRVVRYYRPHDEVVATPIAAKNTGFDNDLYALEDVPPDRRQLLEEEFFSPVDSRAAVTHRLLLDGKLNSLTNRQRVDWARFMMSMQLRSPFSLQELKRLADQNLRSTLATKGDAEYDALRRPEDPPTIYDWTAKYQPSVLENVHKQFLPGLIDHEELGRYLVNMHWATIDVSRAPHTLLTGDRPFIPTHGWKDPNAVLIFPLSPRWLFTATNSPMRTMQVVETKPARLVKEVNNLIAQCAVDFVIGTDNSHLVFVERRLRHRNDEPRPGPIGRGRPGCPA